MNNIASVNDAYVYLSTFPKTSEPVVESFTPEPYSDNLKGESFEETFVEESYEEPFEEPFEETFEETFVEEPFEETFEENFTNYQMADVNSGFLTNDIQFVRKPKTTTKKNDKCLCPKNKSNDTYMIIFLLLVLGFIVYQKKN